MEPNSHGVRAYQTEIVLPTYPTGAPDPNPPFPDGRRVDIYPYAMLDDLSETREDRSYLALVLENEYLRVTVLPELGGHLYSAFDKLADREIFYRNNVVKPGLVALRGAWISGGVEFNFPIGHSVTTVSPVDWRIETDASPRVRGDASPDSPRVRGDASPDSPRVRGDGGGCATIWIGDLERVSRMQWWVGITLRPESSAIETQVIIQNRTPLRRRYYFWTNSAVRATEGLQFICPTDYRKVGGHIGSYPVDEGRDLSWYRNHWHAADVFAYQVREDWFGWYDHSEDAGLVHVANAPECIGKKMFTWGTHDDGLIWADILSDGDGPYCEVQSGRFEDQSTWRLIQPHSVETWREYWYPVAGAGPFVTANRDAALALRKEKGKLHAAVYASRRLSAVLEVFKGETRLLREHLVSEPGKPFKLPVSDGKLSEKDVVLVLYGAADGKVLLRYEPRPEPGPVPPAPPAPPDTAESRYLTGLRAEQAYRMETASEHYAKALELDDDYAPAHAGLGVVALWRGLWQEAAGHFERVLARVPDDAEAHYYLGYAAREMGDRSTAHFHLWQAARVPAFATAARVLLAEMAAAAGETEKAVSLFAALGTDPRARALGAAVMGCAVSGSDIRTTVGCSAPLDALALRQRYLCGRELASHNPEIFRKATDCADAEELRARWREGIRREAETYLEVAHDYLSAGLLQPALEVLLEGAQEAAAPNAMLHYTLGWLMERAGRAEAAGAWFRLAQEAPPEGCFPHRLESIPVLRRAIERDPRDARARLYLGTLLYARGRKEEAVALWDEALAIEPGNALLRRNRGYAAWRAGNLTLAAEQYDAALAAEPEEFHRWIERDRVAEARSETPEERLDRLEGAPEAVRARPDIVARRAALNVQLARFEAAIALIAEPRFNPWEGALGMRRIYTDAWVGLGMTRLAAGNPEGALPAFQRALEYPRNIAVGKPAHPRDAEALLLAGCTSLLCGNEQAATGYWQQAAAEPHPHPSELWYFEAMARARLGRLDEAQKKLEALAEHARAEIARAPDSVAGHYQLGLALLGLERPEESARALAAVLERDPYHFRARFYAAREE